MAWLFVSVVLLIVTSPFIAYLCAKFGTVGHLAGRRCFEMSTKPDLRTFDHEEE